MIIFENIRNYRPYDEEAVITILKEPGGHYLTNDQVDFNGFQEIHVYDEGQGAIGFVCIEVHERLSQIICYVSPKRRREGIGGKLYEFGKSRLEKLDPNTIWLFFRNDVGDSADFYQKRGAEPWYAYHHMFYEKQDHIKSDLNVDIFDEVISCHQKYHDIYIEERAKAFYSINKMIDSRPFDERERKDDLMKWIHKNNVVLKLPRLLK
jgi:GNAT superfamily N-acetyltransferase